MTLDRLIATLRRRIARSHTTGGLTTVAKQLGVTKQTLDNIISGRCVPTAETQASIAAHLTRDKRIK